nr:ribosome biogenesis protein C1orf109 homolog [Lytechinus pictus]
MASSNSSKILDLMHKQLRKSLKNIDSLRDAWKVTSSAASSSINSLQNVIEQYHCTLRCVQSQTPDIMLVKRFPDIHKGVQYKLIQEMELLMEKLGSAIDELQAIHSKVHQQYINSVTVYKKNAEYLPLDKITTGTATWPPIADILEWLKDLDSLFSFLYENQRQVLATVDYENEELMQNLSKNWNKGYKETEESLENVLAHVSFFMTDG